ncbi:hypothetical protein DEO72_LG7g1419 [Vigna unguiculata]|uniref:Uncharacterized protein n=1 Tax=Vigna unguiculata TaxID=3917 RepID=A0A4D6MHD3_VIGUN|nr:hypothetical protein DEO72_LG7g1417 [Vigna unguiculata]QCE00133.1 hypothetical protein DEO72_LG7g1419 [Vigna unguiculata]
MQQCRSSCLQRDGVTAFRREHNVVAAMEAMHVDDGMGVNVVDVVTDSENDSRMVQLGGSIIRQRK